MGLLFPVVLFWVRVLSRALELPSYPTFVPLCCLSYLADADFHNLCEINKYTSSRQLFYTFIVFYFSVSLSLSFQIPPLFDKRNLKWGKEGGGGGRLTNPGVWLGLPAFLGTVESCFL